MRFMDEEIIEKLLGKDGCDSLSDLCVYLYLFLNAFLFFFIYFIVSVSRLGLLS